MKSLNGKIVFLTGAGSGIGRALALQLAKEGAIAVLADISKANLAETLALVQAQGGQASIQLLDIRDEQAFHAAADACIALHGKVDVLINNAGVLSRNVSFLEMDIAHQRFVFDVNFWGAVNGCRAFVPHLAMRQEAAVVNVSSSLAVCGAPFHSAYCASKAAILAYSEVMRVELAGSNIALTVVLPGAAKTNLGANVSAVSHEEAEKTAKNFNRFATTTPETVARRTIAGIKRGKARVKTGIDGKFTVFLGQLFPVTAHRLMGWAYRKVGDPAQYAFIDGLARNADR
jgi:NAD(P)-dependent dehydrogenase (short-subunit alcohol dehydrogenase family)